MPYKFIIVTRDWRILGGYNHFRDVYKDHPECFTNPASTEKFIYENQNVEELD